MHLHDHKQREASLQSLVGNNTTHINFPLTIMVSLLPSIVDTSMDSTSSNLIVVYVDHIVIYHVHHFGASLIHYDFYVSIPFGINNNITNFMAFQMTI
jgi:hypothetical protein